MPALKLPTLVKIFVLIISDVPSLSATNIALNKSAYDCLGYRLSNTIVDGITSFASFLEISSMCQNINSFVDIDLGAFSIVHYIMVYESQGELFYQLDFFMVELRKDNALVGAFQFPEESYGSKGGMRVNCDVGFDSINKVRIQIRRNINIYLSEIEVHSWGMGPSQDKTLIYRGCFNSFDESKRKVFDSLTFNGCQGYCLERKTQFFAIRKTECFCSNDFNEDDEISSNFCVRCTDGRENCGGDDSFSVYIARLFLPLYQGCYDLSNNRNENRIVASNMTVLTCLRHCQNYQFALLQNKNICTCDSELRGRAVSYNSCSLICSGEQSKYCGSESFASIYKTCVRQYNESVKCSKIYKCANQYDQYGDCGGRCQQRFMGENCFTIDPSQTATLTARTTTALSTTATTTTATSTTTSSATFPTATTTSATTTTTLLDPCKLRNPCIDVPHSFCVSESVNFKCECKSGFYKIMETNLCEDIDECECIPCDAMTSTCTNLNGSYDCECRIGFYKIGPICIVNGSDVIGELPIGSWNLLFFTVIMVLSIIVAALFFLLAPRPSSDFSEGISSESRRPSTQ